MKFAHLAPFTPCLLLGLAVIAQTGCVSVAAGLQDWNYERVNQARARKAFHACYDHECRKQLGSDFEDGFRDGYADTATGRDCRVPPVAPPEYWDAAYQSCEGQVCVQNWFKGYQAGIIAAESQGFNEFHEVPTSVEAPVVNRTACGMCQSIDACQCEMNRASGEQVPSGFPLGGARGAAGYDSGNQVVPASGSGSLGLIGASDLY